MSVFDEVTAALQRLTSILSTNKFDWKPSSAVRVLFNTPDGTTQCCIEATECHTIGSIKRFCKTTNSWDQISLTFEGQPLEDEKTLSECGIHSGRVVAFVYEVSDNSLVPIFVQSYIPTFTMYLNTSITVEHLKTLLHFLHGFPRSTEQLLIFAGNQLKDHRQLSECGMSRENCINLVIKMRGGGRRVSNFEFTNVEGKPFEIRESSVNDPSWMKHNDGVNSEGVCNTPDCTVYSRKFVCHHGYGIYRVKEDPTKCPVCHHTSRRVESFGFSRATVIVRAMPLGLKDQPAEIRSDLSENYGKYAYLPFFVLKSPTYGLVLNTSSSDNKNYEFIEVYSSRCVQPTMGKPLCLSCSRTLQRSNACTHGLPDIEPLPL